jgi:citrate lyase subunit beta/citryl-CoA lyase
MLKSPFVCSLGFGAKSAIHPRQIPILNEVFAPSEQDLTCARAVLQAFEAAGGGACRLPNGEFVDIPVAARARRLLQLAGERSATGRTSETVIEGRLEP